MRSFPWLSLVLLAPVACAAGSDGTITDPLVDAGADVDGGGDGADVVTDAVDDLGLTLDVAGDSGAPDVIFDPDAGCATATEEGKVAAAPVDIIWMVDNSASMKPAVDAVIAGMNDFAALISAKSLDYKVILLALRSKTTPITIAGGIRYPICIPPPLSGDASCGNGARFFHSNIDVKSTQPLEQFLGSLDQTAGYKVGEERGAEPWKDQLRPTATKTIVVVTDDNSRLSPTDFETFAGGKNPFNSLTLPVGILHPTRKDLFTGYVFGAVYGWGSATDPAVTCAYADGSKPPASGTTYTTLVAKTAGPRAKICDGAPAWKPFFDAVATAVVKSSKLACELPLPTPSTGTLDTSKVNVRITTATGSTLVPKVADASACGTSVAWYYDAGATKVILCPAACEAANASVGLGKPGKVEIVFGCTSIIK